MVDVGAGDGRFVVSTARSDPDALAVAVDANASALADGHRRARRCRLSNALFVVAAAEALPPELGGVADEVRVQFPWGSLLRGIVGGDETIVSGLAGLAKPGGRLHVLASVVERDRVPGLSRLDEAAAARIAVAPAFVRHGLRSVACRHASLEDVAASSSTWAKRLGVGQGREAWLLAFVHEPIAFVREPQ